MSTSIDPSHEMDSSSSGNASLSISSPPPPLPLPINSPPSRWLSSVAFASDGANRGGGPRGSKFNNKPKIQVIDWHRAFNCEIVLSKIKIPLPEFINAVLSLDSSALGIEQIEDLLRFFPTQVEMEMLKNYSGDKGMLGKCEQFFLELMEVPRVESKLRVFIFTVTFTSQVKNIKLKLNIVKDAASEFKEPVKLRQIVQTILALGFPFKRGSESHIRPARVVTLDSLLGFPGTRERYNKIALLHHLRKVIVERKPELLDFTESLVHLEPVSKICLASLARETQSVSRGLEMVERERFLAENDGALYPCCLKVLNNFMDIAESELMGFMQLYSNVGRVASTLARHFLEDQESYPFEKVIETFVIFTKMLTDDNAYDT